MPEKRFAVAVAALYAVLILFSLGDPLMLLSIGRTLLGERTDLFFSLAPYGIVSLLLAYLTFVKKEKRGGIFFFLMIISIVLFFIVRFLNGEREKLHLLEFAILGGLLIRSAGLRGFGRNAAYGIAVGAGLFIVGLDELLQIALSIKIFSIRDVLVNGMAVTLGAVTYGGLFYDSPPGGEELKTSS
jgi:hypothetical protein